MNVKKPVIFCAIDTQDMEFATHLAREVGPVTKGLKFGLEFFNTFGPQGVEKIRNACPEANIFLDLKFHDIPNTVANAVNTISKNLAPAYLNVHAAGGQAMMEAALSACNDQTKLLSVTILTSLNGKELDKIGYKGAPNEAVERLTRLTHESGLAGVVCSAFETEALRKTLPDDFVLMVPGIRPTNSGKNDQKRVKTPGEALREGATHLVIGRPITKADNPALAAQVIIDDLKEKGLYD